MPAGSFVGALLATKLADSRLGRRNTVILAGIVWVIGSILQCAAAVRNCLHALRYEVLRLVQSQNRGMLVVGRIISGISVGLSSAVVPIYQSEITAPAIRGRIVSLQQWQLSISWPCFSALMRFRNA